MKTYILCYGYNTKSDLLEMTSGFGQIIVRCNRIEEAVKAAEKWIEDNVHTKDFKLGDKYFVVEAAKYESMPELRETVFNSMSLEVNSIAEFGLDFLDSMRRKAIQDIGNKELKIGGYSAGRSLN